MNTIAAGPLSDRLKKPALILLACYWACMLVGTHIPSADVVVPAQLSDKLLHGVAYAILTVLVLFNWSLRAALRWPHWLTILVLVILVGLIDEVTQIPFGRQYDLVDWAADGIGAAGGAAMFAVAAAIRGVGRKV